MNSGAKHIILCNNAKKPIDTSSQDKVIELNYYDESNKNINIGLPNFVRDVFYLPPRILDLLEIAAYIYCADRNIKRGEYDSLEYHNWARDLLFVIKVRDFEFWNSSRINKLLGECLEFMTGDNSYKFIFQSGHKTPPTSLFDRKEFFPEYKNTPSICLFSGGLDSFAGVIEQLQYKNTSVCLVSHQSRNPGTTRTQDKLVKSLKRLYLNRVHHYKFICSLHGSRAIEETQRTRAFLYTSIAFSLIHVLKLDEFFVYENGITAINLIKRQDLINARATRTTHPKSIYLLQKIFSEINDKPIKVRTPFLWKTKSELFKYLKDLGKEKFVNSTVSCSKTFLKLDKATHCGGCSQCIDRRFAAYASHLEDFDERGIYAFNFINRSIEEPSIKLSLVDYIRNAINFTHENIDYFYKERLSELLDIIDYIDIPDEKKAIESIYNLHLRHGQQICRAIQRMRFKHDDLYTKPPNNSLLQIISDREYLINPIEKLIEELSSLFLRSIPIMFKSNSCKNENDLNDKIEGLLKNNKDKYSREHPAISFSLAHTIPDHSNDAYDLFIESKYIRGTNTPSKITDGIAADLFKYPEEKYILFIVYDPTRRIIDDISFVHDFERRRKCKILIIR